MFTPEVMIALLRIVVGLIFMGHGAQKLFGWFGGGGIQGSIGMVTHMGFAPARFWAVMSGLSEFGGGLLLVLGLLTPLGAALIIGTMIIAVTKVHARNGLWNTSGGYEYNLVLMVNALVIGFVGPGVYALDNVLGLAGSTTLLFVVSLSVVLAGSAIALVFSERRTAAQSQQTN